MEAWRETRMRSYFEDRYDYRKNLIDWDHRSTFAVCSGVGCGLRSLALQHEHQELGGNHPPEIVPVVAAGRHCLRDQRFEVRPRSGGVGGHSSQRISLQASRGAH